MMRKDDLKIGILVTCECNPNWVARIVDVDVDMDSSRLKLPNGDVAWALVETLHGSMDHHLESIADSDSNPSYIICYSHFSIAELPEELKPISVRSAAHYMEKFDF